jgi:hypothetical protein
MATHSTYKSVMWVVFVLLVVVLIELFANRVGQLCLEARADLRVAERQLAETSEPSNELMAARDRARAQQQTYCRWEPGRTGLGIGRR